MIRRAEALEILLSQRFFDEKALDDESESGEPSSYSLVYR